MPLLDAITTRFPCLARPVLPFILAAMADIPLTLTPPQGSSAAVPLTSLALLPPDQASAAEAQVLAVVAAAAANNTPQSDQQQGPQGGGAGGAAVAGAGGAGSLAQESVREGRVAGAAQVRASLCVVVNVDIMRLPYLRYMLCECAARRGSVPPMQHHQTPLYT
jgi:hypothetical protein